MKGLAITLMELVWDQYEWEIEQASLAYLGVGLGFLGGISRKGRGWRK